MTFGLSGAAIAGLAVGAAGIGSSLIGASAASSAAGKQAAAAQAGIDAQSQTAHDAIAQQDKQFEALRTLLAPYAATGTTSLNAQGNLAGINGNQPQLDAINGIKNSAQFDALNRQGQDAILQNASATGGLRGGNTQAALAQFSPALLNSLISQQYSRLGGLTSLGENASAMTGNAGVQTGQINSGILTNQGNQTSGLLQQMGAAQAGGDLAAGKATQSSLNSILSGLGTFQGLGGSFGSAPTIYQPYSPTGNVF